MLQVLIRTKCLSLGSRIFDLRRQLGITQADLAEAAGVSPSYIGHLEKDRNRPSREVLVKLAERLEVPAGDLLQAAGYPLEPPAPDDFFMAEAKGLTPEERQMVRTFMRTLKLQRDAQND